jgi:hypothetical protein
MGSDQRDIDFGRDRPMIAIPAADVCGSLQLAWIIHKGDGLAS